MMIKNLLPDVVRRTRADLDQPFYSLQKEMNNLFDSFFRGIEPAPRGFAGYFSEAFSPSIDVKENDKEFIIKAELPGVEEKDIDVTVTGDSVTIREKEGRKRKQG
jgi:HSP20 family protein